MIRPSGHNHRCTEGPLRITMQAAASLPHSPICDGNRFFALLAPAVFTQEVRHIPTEETMALPFRKTHRRRAFIVFCVDFGLTCQQYRSYILVCSKSCDMQRRSAVVILSVDCCSMRQQQCYHFPGSPRRSR